MISVSAQIFTASVSVCSVKFDSGINLRIFKQDKLCLCSLICVPMHVGTRKQDDLEIISLLYTTSCTIYYACVKQIAPETSK